MIKVSDTVYQLITQDPVAFQALELGWLNLSAYADTIQRLVELHTHKSVKKGTIVAALARIMHAAQAHSQRLHPPIVLDDLSIKSPLCDITFNRTPENSSKASNLHSNINVGENSFFTLTQSLSEITIIAPESLAEVILGHFGTKPKAVYHNQVSITVRFAEQYVAVPNVLHTLQAALAINNINFTEIVSTYTEFSFIVEHRSLDLAVQSLQRFFK